MIGFLAGVNDEPTALAANGDLIVLRADKQILADFNQGLSHMESARFWPFRTAISWRRESSVFRHLTDLSA